MSTEDKMVMRFERVDLAELPRAETTAEGFLRVTGRVARTGLQDYRDAKGGIRKELRKYEDVAASVPSFERVPLTNNHPPRMVDPSNAKQYVVGAVGKATISEDGWVTAPFTIYDADAIAAVRAGRAQLSAGYSCEVVNEPGTHEGQNYDGRQQNIVVNHVALVDAARAGPDARMRLDSLDAEAVIDTAFESDTKNPVASLKEIKIMPHVLKIDGFSFEVTDPNAQAAVDRVIAAAKKDGEDKAAIEKARADNADKLRADIEKTLSSTQAERDLVRDKAKTDGDRKLSLGGQEITVTDSADLAKWNAFVSKATSESVKVRSALIVEGRKHLGANEKLDELDEIPLKTMVVKKLAPGVKLDSKSDDYIRTAYDIAIANAPKPVTPIEAARVAMSVTGGEQKADTGPSDDPEEARRRMIERQRAAFKK